MKYYLSLIIILNFIFASSFAEDCPPSAIKTPLDFKTSEAISNLLAATNLSLKEKQQAAEKIYSDNIASFFNSLPGTEQKDISNILNTIKNSKTSLVKIIEAEGDPILFVHGLDYHADFPVEWIKPFSQLIQKKQLSYFFKWSKFKSIEDNSTELVSIIKSITDIHKDKNLTIVAYSAGGVVTAFAMESLADDPISKRIYFHTIASPLFGYNSHPFGFVAIPFVGKTTIQIGRGKFEKITNKHFTQCHHWVNTNCELDQHTCTYNGVNPQLGPSNQTSSPLPCGEKNISQYNNESHASVINRALSEILNPNQSN